MKRPLLILVLLYLSTALLLVSPALRADLANQLCPGFSYGCLGTDGLDLCVDTDENGTFCDNADVNLTMNAPNNDAGDETVQGDLEVVGHLIATGGTFHNLMNVFWVTTNTTVPTAGQCWQPYLAGNAAGACTGSGFSSELSYGTTLRLFCAQTLPLAAGNNGFDSDDVFTVILRDASQTYATLVLRDTAGDVNDADANCVPMSITAYTANTPLFIEADVVAGTPASTVWPYTYFTVLADGPTFP